MSDPIHFACSGLTFVFGLCFALHTFYSHRRLSVDSCRWCQYPSGRDDRAISPCPECGKVHPHGSARPGTRMSRPVAVRACMILAISAFVSSILLPPQFAISWLPDRALVYLVPLTPYSQSTALGRILIEETSSRDVNNRLPPACLNILATRRLSQLLNHNTPFIVWDTGTAEESLMAVFTGLDSPLGFDGYTLKIEDVHGELLVDFFVPGVAGGRSGGENTLAFDYSGSLLSPFEPFAMPKYWQHDGRVVFRLSLCSTLDGKHEHCIYSRCVSVVVGN